MDTIFQYKIIGNAKDSVHLLGPVFKKVNQLMLEGYDPLWIQEILSGVPFFNNAMFSFTYPFYLLNVVDYGSDIHILRTITLVIVLHLFFLFVSNIILLRTLGFSTIISILAGFSIILCLNTAYNATWIIAIAGYAFMPLFFAGIIQIFKNEDSWLGILYLSIASLSFLAKPAQTAILAIVFGGCLTLIGFVINRADWKKFVPKFIIAGLLILGINLPGLVQLFLDFDQLMRFTPNGPVVGNDAIPTNSFRSEVKFSQVINYLLYIKQRIGVGHPWTGPMTLFALFSFWFIKKSNPRSYSWAINTFFVFVIVTIIIVFGKELPTFWLHYHAPLLGKIRESTRFLFITNIGLGVLLAFLLEYFQKETKTLNSQSILPSLFIVFGFFILSIQIWITLKIMLLAFGIFTLGLIGGFLTYRKKNSWRFVVMAVVIICIGFSLLLPNARYGKRENSGWEKQENLNMHKTLKEISGLNKIDLNYRFVYHDSIIKDGEWSNAAMMYGFRSFQGSTVCMPVNQFNDLWHQDANINFRDLWGGRWHLVNNSQLGDISLRYKKIFSNDHHTLLESTYALPRAWTANRIVTYDKDIKAFRRKLKKQKHINRIAYLKSELIASEPIFENYITKTKSEELAITYRPNHLEISTSQRPNPRLIVINEYFSPHWKGSVNGLPIELLEVNLNQIGVLVPAGRHQILLEYKPYPFIYFKWIQKFCFLITFVILGIVVFKTFTKKTYNQ